MCFLLHFLLTQPGMSRATRLCPSAVGRRMAGAFGGEEVTVSAHALQDLRCSLLSFVLRGRLIRNTPFVGSSQYLALHRPWLGAGCSGWRAGGQAGNGDYSKPNRSPAPPGTATSTGRGLGWPTEEGTLPSKQPRKIQQPGRRAMQNKAVVIQEKLQNT